MNNPFSLEGKNILVTGASSGIGRATAIECSKYGAHLVITARNEERLNQTLQSMEGSDHKMITADLTYKEDIENLVNSIGCLDGIVLCAGINDKSLIKFISGEHLNSMLSTNLTGPVNFIQQIVKKKKLNKGASVVFISSVSAVLPSISNAMYASTKAAITQFSKVLALELMSQRIRVNCIEPSFVETEMLKKYALQDSIDEIRNNSPFGRFISPEEVAYTSIYLLSDASQLVTGTSILIDGGFLIKR